MHTTVEKIKAEQPLILNITNAVTVDFVANGLLSLGASPVMSHAEPEIADLVALAKAVVINMGTLDAAFINLCAHVCATANQLQKPLIFDPVGAGASRYRTDMALRLLHDYDIAIVRGNASEIRALAGEMQTTKGVDSVSASEEAIPAARVLSARHHTAVVVSGATDVLVDADEIKRFQHGSPLMPLVTGTGCLFSAVIAAFHAVLPNRFAAATEAIIFYGTCGELAAQHAQGPGSFKSAFLDALHGGV